MADSPVFCTERDLARTFDGGYYDDAWQVVEEYRAATAYASKHDVKSTVTGSALDLPDTAKQGHLLKRRWDSYQH